MLCSYSAKNWDCKSSDPFTFHKLFQNQIGKNEDQAENLPTLIVTMYGAIQHVSAVIISVI